MVCWFVWFIWFVLFFWFLGCVWLRNFVRDFDTGSFLPDKLEKPEKPKRRFLIQHADEPSQRAFRQRIIRVQRERFLVAFDGLLPLSLALVDSAEVQVREGRTLVALGLHGLFEPRDRFVELLLLDQIRADVVVGVAELGIHRNGVAAFLDRLVQLPHAALPSSGARRPAGKSSRPPFCLPLSLHPESRSPEYPYP